MKFKKKTHKRRVWRKMVSPTRSIKEWSRMLHKWWKVDIMEKIKKEFYD